MDSSVGDVIVLTEVEVILSICLTCCGDYRGGKLIGVLHSGPLGLTRCLSNVPDFRQVCLVLFLT